MRKYNIIITAVTTLLFFSCKEQKLDYKYSEKENLTNCSYEDNQLIKEAVYTFESFISEHYAFLGNTTAEGYHNYIKLLFDNRAPASEFFNPHLNEVVSALKKETELWNVKGTQTRLNYKNEFTKCLIESINDLELRNVLTALTSSNTLKPKTLAPVLYRKKEQMDKEDRNLATYVALDMFYSKLIDMSNPGYVEEETENGLIYDVDPNNSTKLEMKPNKKQDSSNK